MNRYILATSQLEAFHRRSAHIPERANTARMIIVPAQLIIENAAAPGCNVDRVFWTMEDYVDFLGDRAFCLLRG